MRNSSPCPHQEESGTLRLHAGSAAPLTPGELWRLDPVGEEPGLLWFTARRYQGWVRTGQRGGREEEEGELANIWASLTGRESSRCGHMMPDTGKGEQVSAGPQLCSGSQGHLSLIP